MILLKLKIEGTCLKTVIIELTFKNDTSPHNFKPYTIIYPHISQNRVGTLNVLGPPFLLRALAVCVWWDKQSHFWKWNFALSGIQ